MQPWHTIEIPDRKEEDDFDVETGSRAEDAEELQEVLEAEPPAAVFAEDVSDARRKWVVKQLVDSFQVLRRNKEQISHAFWV